MIKKEILHVEDSTNTLLPVWKGDKQEMPAIFEFLGASTQENAFIRWKINNKDGNPPEVYEDPAMYESWRIYTESKANKEGMCYVLGKQHLWQPLTRHASETQETRLNSFLPMTVPAIPTAADSLKRMKRAE